MLTFNTNCILCPRLAKFLNTVRKDYPDYHARPVSAFGVKNPKLLIVGLAPGLHGANATGRPFTGDYAGILLYETLHKFGFCNKPESKNLQDGLKLINCRLTNAVKCLPPGNKPVGAEINQCNDYLRQEINAIKGPLMILALGTIAHNAVVKALNIKRKDHPFGHNNLHRINEHRLLIDSYHCSRYNTNTRRLTEKMFHDVFMKIHEELCIT